MTNLRAIIVLLAVALLPALASSHEMRPGYLEIKESSEDSYDVLWKVPARGDNMRLGLYLRFEDDVDVVTEPVFGLLGSSHVQGMRIRR